MRLIPLGVAVIAAALYLVGLGEAPFIDPPEGFHAEIARSMVVSGDAVTPRLNGVRYFDKPPLLYWLTAVAFDAGGVSPFTARLVPALSAVACAAVTAYLGVLLGGARVGLLAGMMTAANLGFYLYGRILKPDMLFTLCITLAYAGFAAAYLGRGGRRGLVVFYVGLAAAALAKDLLGAVGPLLVIAVFFWLTRERPLAGWWPWWGPALMVLIAAPWYVAVEARNGGFLWYTIMDNHVLNAVHHRVFPDEDVPLTDVQFIAVTAAAFLPWSLAAPWALVRALRGPWETPADRLTALLAMWAVLVIASFTFAPFKLPHYSLPAFPALALVVARLWDTTIAGAAGAVRARTLLVPLLVIVVLAALAAGAAWAGVLPIPRGAVTIVDLTTRNMAARGQLLPERSVEPFRPVLESTTLIFAAATAALMVAVWWRWAELGLTIALAAVLAFLPGAGRGVVEFARGRSSQPIVVALASRAQPANPIIHEGSLENTASMLLTVRRPVHVVNGLMSNLAFGATFPDARDVFWTPARLREVWQGPERTFLVSVVDPAHSVVLDLPPERVHLLAANGRRRLYSNLGD